MATVAEDAMKARQVSYDLAAMDNETKNRALQNIKRALNQEKDFIFAENQRDIESAKNENLSAPLLKRLVFGEAKLETVSAGLDTLCEMPDPVGRTLLAREITPDLSMYRVSCPIGVIGMIFESRPDALVQIAGLCLKSGNACLLKGGHEALHTNRALFSVLDRAAVEAGIKKGWAALLETREDVNEMLKMDEAIDLVVPRGSNRFVKFIMENTRIPVMGHAEGLCHVYADKDADTVMAVKLTADSKMQNVSVCNAAETLLVHREIAEKFLPLCAKELEKRRCEIRGCERTQKIIACKPATDEDWETEYLDAILSIKIVDSLHEAVAHINRFGSGHTDMIVTENDEAAREFMLRVDSAGVYRNCSTRFADGYLYGFGAEVGIATGKLHARGPVGPEGLCTYKYKLLGAGQTAEEVYGKKIPLTHETLSHDCPL